MGSSHFPPLPWIKATGSWTCCPACKLPEGPRQCTSRLCCPKSYWSHAGSPSNKFCSFVFSVEGDNWLKISSKRLRRGVGKKNKGNGLSNRTCEHASSNGSLLACVVLQEMCVSQELLACMIPLLQQDIAVTLKPVTCLASCSPSEITVTQKALCVIDVCAWLVIKRYHHFCCGDHYCRRENRLLC